MAWKTVRRPCPARDARRFPRRQRRRKTMAAEITDATFDSVISGAGQAVLVDFWAPWCGPCRALGPVIEELAKEYEGKVQVVKMNVDENPSTPARFGIRAIPTLILFKNGEVVEQITGAVAKSALQDMLAQKA
ncbi:MAG: thioredoxin [Desulfovibrionaceae bacterium]|nr:thioredoxin [Desulfovibrionaceae bacterium]